MLEESDFPVPLGLAFFQRSDSGLFHAHRVVPGPNIVK
jgi:hypothetical protein